MHNINASIHNYDFKSLPQRVSNTTFFGIFMIYFSLEAMYLNYQT